MARGRWTAVAGQFRQLFADGTAAALDERQCLDRFVARRDPAAFEALVARHGPMVLGVCRRWLDDPNDADDAFQATFLVLVRRAGDLHDRDLLANWLYGVATRVARRARQQARRRRCTEAAAAEHRNRGRSVGFAPRDDGFGPELDEALGRLPRDYRSVLILCDVEGRTHEEAARDLGWPLGTVKGRLARARDRLRDRLARRGVGVGSALIVAALGAEAHAVPPVLLDTTLRAAVAAATGRLIGVGVVSATVVQLTEGVIAMMVTKKLAMTSGVGLLLMSTALAGIAATGRLSPAAAQAQGRAVSPAPAPAPPSEDVSLEVVTGDTLTRLEQAHLDLVREAFQTQQTFYSQGQTTIDRLIQASERLRDAELAADPAADAPHRASRAHLGRMEALSKACQAAFDAGRGSPPDLADARVAEAEARLLVARLFANLDQPREIPGSTSAEPSLAGIGGGVGAGGAGGVGGGFGGGGFGGGGEERPAAAKFFRAVDDDPQSRAVLAKLDEAHTLPFREGIPLADLPQYLRQITADDAHFPQGIPVYLDEAGIADSGAANEGLMRIDLDGIPLRTGLRLMLKQLKLTYIVKEGLLIISSPEADSLLDEIERGPEPNRATTPGK